MMKTKWRRIVNYIMDKLILFSIISLSICWTVQVNGSVNVNYIDDYTQQFANKAILQYNRYMHNQNDSNLALKVAESLHIVIALYGYNLTKNVQHYARLEIYVLNKYIDDSANRGKSCGYVSRLLAEAYFQADEDQKAEKVALSLIKLSKKYPLTEDLFIADETLGLIALQHHNVSKADNYLLAAGNVPYSRTINVWAPNVRLLHALLIKKQWNAATIFCKEIEKNQHLDYSSWIHDFKKDIIPEMSSSLRY